MIPVNTCARCGALFAGETCACTGSAAAGVVVNPGETFHGLTIVREIGRGGMGVVYEARQPSLDRSVALKILPPGSVESELRFEREAKTLATLSHPNIVSVYDAGKDRGFSFLTMEYVAGTNLRAHLRGKRPSPTDTLRILSELCDALSFAHGEGLVHRDIKPENVLLDRNGRVRVVDFGIAKAIRGGEPRQELTLPGVALGTRNYMAPEQLENTAAVDHRADLYSTGVLMYEMLTGELPLGRFDPPSRKEGTDPGWDRIVGRALEKDPSRRYQTALEMKSDLEALGSKPTRSRKQPSPGVFAAAVGIILLAGGTLLYLRRQTPPPRPDLQPEVLKRILSEAAELSPDPSRFADHRLSSVLLAQHPAVDIEIRDRDALKRRSSGSSFSLLRPESIRELEFKQSGDRADGTIAFETDAYRGKVLFSAAWKEGRWRVVEFRCPKGRERTVRGADGKWKLLPAPAPHGMDRFRIWESGRLLERGFSRSGVLGRDVYIALSPPEVKELLAFLSRHVRHSLSVEGVRRGFAAAWTGGLLFAIDMNLTPAPPIQHSGGWSVRMGETLLLALPQERMERAVYLEIVRRVSAAAGRPFRMPPLPFAFLELRASDLPGGWKILSAARRSERPPKGCRAIYRAAIGRDKAGASDEIEWTAFEFDIPSCAAEFEIDTRAAKRDAFFPVRSGETVALLRSRRESRGFTRLRALLRRLMGGWSNPFYLQIPEPNETPPPFRLTREESKPGRVIAAASLKGVSPSDLIAAWYGEYAPEGRILLLEAPETKIALLRRIRDRLAKIGTVLTRGTTLCWVAGPGRDRLLLFMRGKIGLQ